MEMQKMKTHLGIGTLTAPLKALVNKKNLTDALKLGGGAAGGIVGANLLMSRVLVKDGRPLVPDAWAPAATAVLGMLGAGIAKQFVGPTVATGIIAGTVGVAISKMVDRFMSPAPAVAVAAEQAAAGADSMSGLSFAGLSGSGIAGALPSSTSLYGVGTPDMSGAQMFNGAAVAIEQTGGPMGGAAVEIENSQSIAGIFN